MENLNKPQLMKGGLAADERGSVSFVNDFDFKDVKRFYIIKNISIDFKRGFHGHMKEEKYAFVSKGKALILAVALDDPENPDKNNKVHQFILDRNEPSVLHIPAGYANGTRALESDTEIIFFSTLSLEDSKNDDFPFPPEYWGEEIWNI